jgi:hypothetical protein
MDTEQKIQFIMNQTSYDYNTAKGALEMFDDDYLKVIKCYHGINDKPETNKTLNQEIFRLIREQMKIN